MPIVEFPPYMEFARDDYENAYKIYEMGLNLPSSTVDDFNTIEKVVKIAREVPLKGCISILKESV